MRSTIPWSTVGLVAISTTIGVVTWKSDVIGDTASQCFGHVIGPDRTAGAPAPGAASSKPTNAVEVDAVPARASDIPIVLAGIGTVQALNTVAVRSRVDGAITAVLFREGQDVEAGQPLATIDSRLIQAQVAQQEAALSKDQALFDGASLDLHRYEALVTKNFTSEQQVDQQRSLVTQYKAQTNVDVAQIASARTQLEYTTIKSPISGRTGVRKIDVGNYVRAGDNTPIVVVSQLKPISVVFTLPAVSVAASRLVPGETQIPVVVLAADGRSFLDRGTVELVDNLVDQSTGTIKLKATFPNGELKLWPGSFVEGRLTVDVRHNAVTVPRSAVRHGPRGDFVFIVAPDGTARIRDIRAGQEADDQILIEKGLAAGDLVVTAGQLKLDDGTPVDMTPFGKTGAGVTPVGSNRPPGARAASDGDR